jgi:hypothetical protein
LLILCLLETDSTETGVSEEADAAGTEDAVETVAAADEVTAVEEAADGVLQSSEEYTTLAGVVEQVAGNDLGLDDEVDAHTEFESETHDAVGEMTVATKVWLVGTAVKGADSDAGDEESDDRGYDATSVKNREPQFGDRSLGDEVIPDQAIKCRTQSKQLCAQSSEGET